MDTLKFALALEAEGMAPKHASIIAHEMYAIYAHSVLGGKYKEIDYGDFDELSARAKAVRDKKQAMEDALRKMNDEMEQEREAREAEQAKWRQEQQAREAESAAAQESIRETTAYLKVRLELNQEQKRLDFVLEHGSPMERDGQFRYHGWPHLGWFKTQRAAIDAAVKYPPEGK